MVTRRSLAKRTGSVIASVAYWYQTLPARPFPKLPAKDYLEII